MREFGKRLSWRLTAGLVTIAMGALAAAQAQREGYLDATIDENVPQLDQPAWANSLPEPIAPHPVMAQGFADSTVIAQAGYESPSLAASGDEGLSDDGPGTQFGPVAVQAAYEMSDNGPSHQVAMVGYNEAGAEAPADAAAAEAVAGGPAMSMALPEAMLPTGEPEMVAADAPMMGLPDGHMAMPVADAAAAPMMPPADQAMVDAGAPGMPLDASQGMPELQMEQGPGLAMPEPAGASPAHLSPDMPAPQGFANLPPADQMMPAQQMMPAEPMMPAEQLPSGAPAAEYNNALRAEVPMSAATPMPGGEALPDLPQPNQMGQFNPMRSPTQAAPQPLIGQQLPEPSQPQLPQPNPYAPSPYHAEATFAPQPMSNVPAQFAGHQRQPQAGMPAADRMLPGQQDLAHNLPGDRRLEGAQTPSVVIQKRAPAEVKVGKPATFVVQVQNVGSADALNVQVYDQIPTGMQLVDSTPQPQMQGGNLLWNLGDMAVGAERSITMQLVPMEEGELGSVARVTFEAAASVRTRSTRPELKITQQAPQKVLIGQQLEIELAVGNIGTGGATNVVLQVDVPPGLDHPQGRELDNLLGDLRPGQERREVLRLRAVEPGMIQNTVTLIADDAQPVTHTVNVEVVAPSLAVGLTGPSRRYLERPATYDVNIENQGTAQATNVEIKAFLDRGFTFVSTENNGHYDPNQHAVIWSIANLPAGQLGSVPVTLMPIEEGNQAIRLEAMADLNVRGQSESIVQVESQAELTFSIADTADPIELGSETVYEIRVKNSGSRNDTNVQVQLQLPPGLELLDADSEVRTNDRGGVMLAPQKQMAAGAESVYRLRVRGVQPDTHLVKAIVTSDQSRVPVTKEESTMVYADR